MKRRIHRLFALTAALAIVLVGCGGGGEGTEPQSGGGVGVSMLAWDPPQAYVDSSPLDPYRELAYYELYVRNDPNFTDNDAPAAQVAAVENVLDPGGQSYHQVLTSAFGLANLLPFTFPGEVHYVSIRAVGIDGLKSDFSTPVVWDLS